jgi:hypothetical protein
LKVVGALNNYSLVFVFSINFFGQLKDWVGQVLFLVSCPKGQVEKYVNVEAWHLVERDKPKKSESVGQTLPQLPWKQKSGIKNIFGFLSSNFMKLCRNIHRSVWQLLGVEKNSKWRPLPW